jgi:hypothetical protein
MAAAAPWSPLRHALTNARAASEALPAGTIGSVVVVGAVVVVVVVGALDEEVSVVGEPSFEHAASIHTQTMNRAAAGDEARRGIGPT